MRRGCQGEKTKQKTTGISKEKKEDKKDEGRR